jgi:hypothetical protein
VSPAGGRYRYCDELLPIEKLVIRRDWYFTKVESRSNVCFAKDQSSLTTKSDH